MSFPIGDKFRVEVNSSEVVNRIKTSKETVLCLEKGIQRLSRVAHIHENRKLIMLHKFLNCGNGTFFIYMFVPNAKHVHGSTLILDPQEYLLIVLQ